MASPSCVYDPLEDSEFDETDSDEEEQDETDTDEEEQDEFKDAEEHNNADDQHVGTSTASHNDSDPLFGDIPEEDKDLTQSPVSLGAVFCSPFVVLAVIYSLRLFYSFAP